MLFKNTTIQNRSKHHRLSHTHTIPNHNIASENVREFLISLRELKVEKELLLYSLGCQLVRDIKNPALEKFKSEFKHVVIKFDDVPENEFDLLGSAYQFLNSKRENLEKGSFYTGREIAEDFVFDLDFSKGQFIFDPSCGSGSFLFRSSAPAKQIYGVDQDPIAVMIAKFNYFLKFPKGDYPQIFHQDFFTWYTGNADKRFDYVIGNPPYGANLDLSNILSDYVTSGESFSYFLEFGYRLLSEKGVFRYLLPESILNVKRHSDIRNFILDETNLKRIKRYSKKFTGVMSDVFLVELDRALNDLVVFEDNGMRTIPKNIYRSLQNNIFVDLSKMDILILEKVNKIRRYDLSSSTFGLGVVTGDNLSKLLVEKIKGSEPIYTGKEVEKYNLLEPKKYLVFDREKLQQVAPDEIYRAPVKLVYKTINKYLKVSIDTNGALTSNSANIIIPKIEELSPHTILALLNSNLYSFLHLKMFGGVNKIAKENLMALPFPEINKTAQQTIHKLVMKAIGTLDDAALQKYINEEIFHLTPVQVAHIDSTLRQ